MPNCLTGYSFKLIVYGLLDSIVSYA